MTPGAARPVMSGGMRPVLIRIVRFAADGLTPYEAYCLADTEAGSAGMKKRWRCDNYQHKTDGMRRHKRRLEARKSNS